MDASTMASKGEAEVQSVPKRKTAVGTHYPFWFGGSASSMGACVTHPLDLVKVRLQTRTASAPSTTLGTALAIVRSDGPRGLYSGLSASLLRQMTYSTVRFGIYEALKERYAANESRVPIVKLIAMASVAGLAGGFAGNFADVVNVRMQHDAALPPSQRRNYRHAVDGVVRMAREEGFASLFRGVVPNSTRAIAMTTSQLASYDTFKSLLLEYTPMGDTLTTHFTASFFAGVVAATVTSPVDVIKTRVMSSSTPVGIVDVIRSVHQQYGMRWMFKGWTPSFLRLGPQTICTFVFLEMHRTLWRRWHD